MSTERFWQRFTASPETTAPPYFDRYAVMVSPGCFLSLPIRIVPGDGNRAVASLLVNHASFEVVDGLIQAMAERARGLRPDVIVGLPTLGLSLAPGIAQLLGHSNYVPLGYSRKFWYEDSLSVEISSITSPGQGKRLYLDPNLRPRLQGGRVLLVDDAVSRGTSMAAARKLMALASITPVGAAVAMAQTNAWREPLKGMEINYLFASPALERHADGWWPVDN